MPDYLPYDQREPSTAYRDMLAAIRDGGTRLQTKQGEEALALAGHCMRFPMAHGAAVITERSIKGFVSKAIGELCAFINGARTLEELREFGCDWWDAWATEEKCRARGLEPGDLGPGSYGHAFRNFTTDLDGEDPGFDQLPHLVAQAARPAARPHGDDEPVDPQRQPPRGGRALAQHDRALPRLDPRARVRRGAAPDPQPALGRHADRRALEHGPVHGAGADARAAHRVPLRRVRALDPVRAHLRQPAAGRGRDARARAAAAADAAADRGGPADRPTSTTSAPSTSS